MRNCTEYMLELIKSETKVTTEDKVKCLIMYALDDWGGFLDVIGDMHCEEIETAVKVICGLEKGNVFNLLGAAIDKHPNAYELIEKAIESAQEKNHQHKALYSHE